MHKKNTKSTQAQHTPTAGCTFIPAITREVCEDIFRKSLPAKGDGESESHLERFMGATRALMSMRTFTVNDALYYMRPFDIPAEETTRLFNLWAQKMVSLCKVEMIDGVYDTPIYITNQ